jgi:anhydro-N-acetylmuramic acid kinase
MMDGEGLAGVVRALGAMSGTSLDGVDAAVIETDGAAIHAFGPSAYRSYSEAERAVLTGVLGRWPGPGLEAAQEVVMQSHAEVLSGFEDIALVGFHGQTLAHDPAGRGTHQLGDGAALAGRLGLPVVWDFRTADVAAGGEGAPLAPFFHHACARWMRAGAPLAFLNLGGVGNLTWVDPSVAAPEAPGALLSFDTGPANAPINDLMQARRGLAYDEDAGLAAQGRIDQAVLNAFMAEAYFARLPPKSLDRNDFGDLLGRVAHLEDADAAATLTAMAVQSVLQGIAQLPTPPERLLVTGGGRRNPVMMAMLRAALSCPVEPVEAHGLDGDMLEAQAFAYLAVRVLRGLPTSCATTTGVGQPTCGGVISHP